MTETFQALSLLRPYEIDCGKIRIGPQKDGGYILADCLTPKQPVMSYGIANEYSFDRSMAKRGHNVFMFDHTIEGIEDRHELMHFRRQGVCGKSRPDENLYSVQDHISMNNIGPNIILKMDVEGHEWEAFDRMDLDTLRCFEQIVMEIHSLELMDDFAWRSSFVRVIEKINSEFTLFHIHANNVDGTEAFHWVSGLPVSCLLEVSFVKTALVSRRANETVYPTELDFPNFAFPDKLMWCFPFLPSGFSEQDLRRSFDRSKRLGLSDL